MGLLEKIENLINRLLIMFGDQFMKLLIKHTPVKVKNFLTKAHQWILNAIVWCKQLPKKIITVLPGLLNGLKSDLLSFNYKEKLNETYKAAMAQYANQKSGEKISKLKTLLMTPFLMLGQWLKGLSASQSLLLLGFSAASFLMGINMIFSGHRLVDKHLESSRAPASAPEEIQYDRPEYYKMQIRHLEFTSIRLPVFFPNVNELKSVDIDFTATLSNRMSKMQMEKLEFQFRDHLVLNIEPMVASFPLEEEGKEIIRQKLILELKDFMASQKIEAEVSELKITYILAN